MQKEQKKEGNSFNIFKLFIKAQILSFIISFVLILSYALLLSFSSISDETMPKVTQGILIFSVALSNLFISVKGYNKKSAWLLCMINGLIFAIILVPFGMFFGQTFDLDVYLIAKLFVGGAAGAIGGIIGSIIGADNFRINRKFIVISCSIFALAGIMFFYNLFTTDNYKDVDYALEIDEPAAKEAFAQQAPESKTEQQAVNENSNTQSVEAETFFTEYRMERDKNRSKEVEMWQEVINKEDIEKNFKDLAQQELIKIVALTEQEMIIENLIISIGFNDALAFFTDDSATVIVETKELSPEQVARIQDIVIRKTKLDPSAIKIMKK